MRAGTITQAAAQPQQFNFNRLYGNIYELEAADGIQAVKVKTAHGSGQEADQERQEYKYTRYTATVEINNYDEAVAALVRLKYSSSDEFALMRKGQEADQDNAEYAAYLDYVSACKAFARLHFES